MKKFSEILREIYREHRGLFWMMVLLAVIALGFLVFSLINLKPASANVNTGYSDIGSYSGGDLAEMQSGGGYRSGKWAAMIVFPFLAVIIGVMHNFIAMKLYDRRGEGIAKGFVGMSIALILMAFVILVRLLGEG